MPVNKNPPKANFCNECGARLVPDALFCHSCGTPVQGRPSVAPVAETTLSAGSQSRALRWGVPFLAIAAIVVLTAVRMDTRGGNGAAPLGDRTSLAPDISAMSPEEQADRLFNRVMRLASEGKADSAAFFGPMALGAFEGLAPLNAHQRYDMGLVALVTGEVPRAAAQSDSILAQRPTHLLGLVLATRAADARGDAAATRGFRRRLLAAEPAERARSLPEYQDHDADIRAAIELARKSLP